MYPRLQQQKAVPFLLVLKPYIYHFEARDLEIPNI